MKLLNFKINAKRFSSKHSYWRCFLWVIDYVTKLLLCKQKVKLLGNLKENGNLSLHKFFTDLVGNCALGGACFIAPLKKKNKLLFDN